MLWAQSSELNYPRLLFNSLTLWRSICWWRTMCWTLFEVQRQKKYLIDRCHPCPWRSALSPREFPAGSRGAPSCWDGGLGLTNLAQFLVTLSISISSSLHSKTLAQNLLRKCKSIALAKYSNVLKELLMCFSEVIFQWTSDMLTFYYKKVWTFCYTPGDEALPHGRSSADRRG